MFFIDLPGYQLDRLEVTVSPGRFEPGPRELSATYSAAFQWPALPVLRPSSLSSARIMTCDHQRWPLAICCRHSERESQHRDGNGRQDHRSPHSSSAHLIESEVVRSVGLPIRPPVPIEHCPFHCWAVATHNRPGLGRAFPRSPPLWILESRVWVPRRDAPAAGLSSKLTVNSPKPRRTDSVAPARPRTNSGPPTSRPAA